MDIIFLVRINETNPSSNHDISVKILRDVSIGIFGVTIMVGRAGIKSLTMDHGPFQGGPPGGRGGPLQGGAHRDPEPRQGPRGPRGPWGPGAQGPGAQGPRGPWPGGPWAHGPWAHEPTAGPKIQKSKKNLFWGVEKVCSQNTLDVLWRAWQRFFQHENRFSSGPNRPFLGGCP